ncbi:glutathione S-transferase N-terminal domain-containing protein [Aliihoeflea sp. 2WW]|uniref:glutathione S-transferase N-terminal domain-containing protein n=1 Tax=Aliihoeflea sp. 2WW TaxID=1381123 RepID=UPI000463F914|nr:glutathione S-transferase N-terminal domain-containing protein [Aliihoeflea sp. 2WW]
MKLLSATPSPYARKVRIALIEKGLPFDLVTEVPWDASTSTPRYNPLEKLPVLILDDGTSIYESSLILQYLELTHPRPRLLPTGVGGIIAARRVEVLCDGICDAIILLFWELKRPEAFRSHPWLARQRRKVDGGLNEVARLVGTREWAVGNAFGLADIAAGTLLRFLDIRFPELGWREKYPHLVGYSDRMETRPSFRQTTPRAQHFSDPVV